MPRKYTGKGLAKMKCSSGHASRERIWKTLIKPNSQFWKMLSKTNVQMDEPIIAEWEIRPLVGGCLSRREPKRIKFLSWHGGARGARHEKGGKSEKGRGVESILRRNSL